jgi:hypothetical protein
MNFFKKNKFSIQKESTALIKGNHVIIFIDTAKAFAKITCTIKLFNIVDIERSFLVQGMVVHTHNVNCWEPQAEGSGV